MSKNPDYQKIYKEITERFHPDKMDKVKTYIQKEEWTSFDVITVSNILINKKKIHGQRIDRQHKAYDEHTIKAILKHQKEYGMNNSEAARFFKISRNTIISWKKIYSKTLF